MLGGALILSQEAALQARYSRQLSPLLFVPVRHELEEQSRNCFKQLNLFCWPRREKRLCLPLPHNVLAAQQQGQLCLFVRLKRSWLGTKVGKWGTWDTGKTEPGLPECRVFPLHNCIVLTKAHSALLSSALSTQNTHTGEGEGLSHPLQGVRHFFPLFGHTEASFFPFWAAAFQCSELWLVLEARAELQCINHLLGLEQHSGPPCLQLSAEILFETSSFWLFAVPLTDKA